MKRDPMITAAVEAQNQSDKKQPLQPIQMTFDGKKLAQAVRDVLEKCKSP